MLYANSEAGEKITASKGVIAFCPMCKSDVVAKCGNIVRHHWSHKSIVDCDTWHEPETEWHLKWKSFFPSNNVEVSISKDEKLHRADVLTQGLVIEFQHSPISTTEIAEREDFYGNMIWIFDVSSKRDKFYKYNLDRFEIKPYCASGKEEIHFHWDRPRKSLLFCRKPIYLDFKCKQLLFLTRLDEGGTGYGYYVDKNSLIVKYGGALQDRHLTKRALDWRESAPLPALSQHEVDSIGGADTTPPANQ